MIILISTLAYINYQIKVVLKWLIMMGLKLYQSFMIFPIVLTPVAVELWQSGKADEYGNFESEFVGLPEGEYAVVVVHDANDNGKLDNGFLGFGGESYGYSNSAQPWFGRPDFEDVKIMVDQPGTMVEIDFN